MMQIVALFSCNDQSCSVQLKKCGLCIMIEECFCKTVVCVASNGRDTGMRA